MWFFKSKKREKQDEIYENVIIEATQVKEKNEILTYNEYYSIWEQSVIDNFFKEIDRTVKCGKEKCESCVYKMDVANKIKNILIKKGFNKNNIDVKKHIGLDILIIVVYFGKD